MSEKNPRLKPHTMTSLAKAGIEMYRPPILNPDQQRKIGQMSLTDGVPVIRENVYQPENTSGVFWPE